MALDVSPERFDTYVDRALDSIPAELARLVRNVVLLVEDEPLPGEPPDTLGLYDGVALTERDSQLGGQLPDRIFLFRRPLLDFCRDEAELIEEIRVTVVHEVAHHFGISDARLHELGWA